MKVADGFWLSKQGYNVNYASQAYKVETTENSIKVLATPYTVLNRGMTWEDQTLRSHILLHQRTSSRYTSIITEEDWTTFLVMS